MIVVGGMIVVAMTRVIRRMGVGDRMGVVGGVVVPRPFSPMSVIVAAVIVAAVIVVAVVVVMGGRRRVTVVMRMGVVGMGVVAMIVMPGGRGVGRLGVGFVTVPGVMAVVVVRLVLVAHLDPVPQPLFRGLSAAKPV
ncbi:hypothetical protein [Brevundimonas sp.]|uniref:hypothetical protein n=1 Tax=Brevundimonas sp. TaxID=1871086 RepID=UPI002D3BBE5C|nr:hypothetical protein [Brevundimonas sp.]HYD29049.1 hypothetical protein [Brevundimonas sp.]